MSLLSVSILKSILKLYSFETLYSSKVLHIELPHGNFIILVRCTLSNDYRYAKDVILNEKEWTVMDNEKYNLCYQCSGSYSSYVRSGHEYLCSECFSIFQSSSIYVSNIFTKDYKGSDSWANSLLSINHSDHLYVEYEGSISNFFVTQNVLPFSCDKIGRFSCSYIVEGAGCIVIGEVTCSSCLHYADFKVTHNDGSTSNVCRECLIFCFKIISYNYRKLLLYIIEIVDNSTNKDITEFIMNKLIDILLDSPISNPGEPVISGNI